MIDLDSMSFVQGSHFMSNTKTVVPEGSFRKQKKGYEEVHVPAVEQPAPGPDEPVIYIKQLPEWAQAAFPKTERLNRVQSRLYKTGMLDSFLILFILINYFRSFPVGRKRASVRPHWCRQDQRCSPHDPARAG